MKILKYIKGLTFSLDWTWLAEWQLRVPWFVVASLGLPKCLVAPFVVVAGWPAASVYQPSSVPAAVPVTENPAYSLVRDQVLCKKNTQKPTKFQYSIFRNLEEREEKISRELMHNSLDFIIFPDFLSLSSHFFSFTFPNSFFIFFPYERTSHTKHFSKWSFC